MKQKQVIEFISTISESKVVDDDFVISGTALSVTTSQNGIFYPKEELQRIGGDFAGKILLKNHDNSTDSAIGRVTQSWFDESTESIQFKAIVIDDDIQRKINLGVLTDCSIGCSVTDLIEQEDGSKKAVGLMPMELSIVSIPGISSANFTKNLSEGAMYIHEDFTIQNKKGGISKMATKARIRELRMQLAEVEDELDKAEGNDSEDTTKGTVGSNGDEESEETTEGYVVEQAETGKGFAIWRDYAKVDGKLKRLTG